MSLARAERLAERGLGRGMLPTSGERGSNELRCQGCARRLADVRNDLQAGSASIEAHCPRCKILTTMVLKAI